MPRCSSACCTKTWACSGRSASTAWGSTTGSGSTSTSSGISKADTRRIITSGPINPSTGLLYGAALAIALGLLGYNVVVNEQISIATMLILVVSLAGLAYPVAEWLRLRKAIRQANRSARGIFEFLERRPELHQNVGAQFLTPSRSRSRSRT